MTTTTYLPTQPIIKDSDGVIRFRESKLIRYIKEHYKVDLNDLLEIGFSDVELKQFVQLLGYSIDKYDELSFTTTQDVALADYTYKHNHDIAPFSRSATTTNRTTRVTFVDTFSALIGAQFFNPSQLMNYIKTVDAISSSKITDFCAGDEPLGQVKVLIHNEGEWRHIHTFMHSIRDWLETYGEDIVLFLELDTALVARSISIKEDLSDIYTVNSNGWNVNVAGAVYTGPAGSYLLNHDGHYWSQRIDNNHDGVKVT